MIFVPEGLIGIFHRIKAAIQHARYRGDNRTWLRPNAPVRFANGL